MVYDPTGLLVLLTVITIYLKSRGVKDKPSNTRIPEQASGIGNTKKQQQTDNLFAVFLIQVISKYKQIEARLTVVNSDNESLKQSIEELREQSKTLECERNEAREASTELRLNNALFSREIEQTESSQQALIQEMSKALGCEDLECATWQAIIKMTKLLSEERKQFQEENDFLKLANNHLIQSNELLNSQLDVKGEEISSLSKKLSCAKVELSSLQISCRETEISDLQHDDEFSSQTVIPTQEQICQKEIHAEFISLENKRLNDLVQELQRRLYQKADDIALLKQDEIQNSGLLKSSQEQFYQKELNFTSLLNSMRMQIDCKENEISDLRQKHEKLSQIVVHNQEQIRQKEVNIQSLYSDKKELDGLLQNSQNQLHKERGAVAVLKQSNIETSKSLKSLQEQFDKKEIDSTSFKEQTKSLQEQLNQKENELSSLRQRNVENQRLIGGLKQQLSQKEKEIEQQDINTQQLTIENKRLLEEIMQLKAEPDKSLKDLNEEVNLVEEYNRLIYFMQVNFPHSQTEEIADWLRDEKFYFEIIKQLYSISNLLVGRIIDLEEQIISTCKADNNRLGVTEDYLNKVLYWCDKGVEAELEIVLPPNSWF